MAEVRSADKSQADLSAPWRTGGGTSRPAPTPLVAVVLPPREGFGPGRTGAIGLIAHRLAAAPGFRTMVIGGQQVGPTFTGAEFHAVRPPFWLPGNINTRYAAGVARLLRRLRPALIEVHNRPEVALALARRLPDARVGLFLHNDPQSMRSAYAPGRAADPAVAPGPRRHRVRLSARAAARGRRSRRPCCPSCCRTASTCPPCHRRASASGSSCSSAGWCRTRRRTPSSPPVPIALPRLPGWRAEIIGADRSRADSPDTRFVRGVRERRPGRRRASARLSRPSRGARRAGRRRHRGGAQPLAGAVRPHARSRRWRAAPR